MKNVIAKKNNKGFSLIELIIAIAILVILTGLLAPNVLRYVESSREAKDEQAIDTVSEAMQAAYAEASSKNESQSGNLTASWSAGAYTAPTGGTEFTAAYTAIVTSTPTLVSSKYSASGKTVSVVLNNTTGAVTVTK